MRTKIRQLEEQLQRVTTTQAQTVPSAVPNPNPHLDTAISGLGGTFFIHHGDPALGQLPGIHRSVTHKKRMFGQSHWMNHGIVLVRDIAAMVDEHARGFLDEQTREGTANIYSKLQRCKHLARVVKAQRTPAWPCPPTSELPPKAIADELLDCYLQTSESIYRVLHVPSFRRDYESIWGTESEVDKPFLVLLKLVLAIGAATYDENFTLRPSATRWVYEAVTWLSDPALKHRLGLQYLQIHTLLLIAREVVAVGEDLVWISAGSLLRAAMLMGLHRDPVHLPARSSFANEMHRRLWSTILEVTLQTSLNSGGPPLISLEDFDTQLPGNFEDEQLTGEAAVPKPENEFTQSSVAIALSRTFPARLAVTRFLNNFGSSGAYEETLRLDSDFRAAYRRLRSTFQGFNANNGASPSSFDIGLVDTILHRYLSALHLPFFSSSLHDTAHAYSRKVTVDASLKLWYAAYAPTAIGSTPCSHATAPSKRSRLERLIACGHGFLRVAAVQAMLVIGVELRELIQEDDGLGPMPLRRDLVAVMEDSKAWSLWSLVAGETNVKGYLFSCLLVGQINGLLKGLGRTEISALLAKVAEEAEDECLSILEGMVDQSQPEQAANDAGRMSMDINPELFDGWDFMVSACLHIAIFLSLTLPPLDSRPCA